MRHLCTVLMLAVVFGGILNVRQVKSQTLLRSVNSEEINCKKKKNLQSPVHPLFPEKQEQTSWVTEATEKTFQTNPLSCQVKPGSVPWTPAMVSRSKTHASVLRSSNANEATITLKVIGDPWGDESGFQILLDSKQKMIDESQSIRDLYKLFDYSIPVGVTMDWENPVMLLNDSVSITIPEGIYDFVFLNVVPFYKSAFLARWLLTGTGAIGNDFTFKAGYEYRFVIEKQDFVMFYTELDAALANLIVPASSEHLTDSETIQVSLVNAGSQAFSSVELSYLINDRSAVTETYTGSMQPGDTVVYTFNTKADLSANSIYKIIADVKYGDDMNPLNDNLIQYSKHRPLALPFISKFNSEEETFVRWSVAGESEENLNWKHKNDVYDADEGSGCICVEAPRSGAADYYLVSEALNFPAAGDYHISFYAMPGAKESFQVLYGTSPDVSAMSIVLDEPAFDLLNKWSFFVKNITVSTPGTYYFAFHYYSRSDDGRIMGLDNVSISTGAYRGVPDIMFRNVRLPASSCSLSPETPVEITVINAGSDPISQFEASYKVNETDEVSEVFNEPLDVMQTKTVQFGQKANFSQIGDYTVAFQLSTPGESNISNNVHSAAFIHFDPVTTLPFETDFSKPEDVANWIPAKDKAWLAHKAGCYIPNEASVALFSRCMTLQAEEYRFSYTYSAGYSTKDQTLTDDFYIAYGKAGSDPLTWTPVKEYKECNTNGVKATDHLILPVTEAGDYAIAFVAKKIGNLAIFKTSVSVMLEHEVWIEQVKYPMSFARQIPQSQIAGERDILVKIQNRGKHPEDGQLEVKMHGQDVASVPFRLANLSENKEVPVSLIVPELPAGPVELQFTAAIDSRTEQHSLKVNKIVSDSSFVWDSIDANFTEGLGFSGTTGAVGLIYELLRKDVLTSINIGFQTKNLEDDFSIVVYPVDENGSLGEPVFAPQVQPRPQGGSSITFAVPPTELNAGKYFFEVRQLTNINYAIAYDKDPQGGLYAHFEGNTLEYIGSKFGYIHVRPNFGKLNVGLKGVESNMQLTLYPNPATDVLHIRTAGQTIQTVSVSNVSGNPIYRNSEVNASEYTLDTSRFGSGIYFISVQTGAGVKVSKLAVK